MVRLEAYLSSHHLIFGLLKYLRTYELYFIILFGTFLSFIPYMWLNCLYESFNIFPSNENTQRLPE